MQLAGPGVWGPPTDPAEAVAVLRRAVELGVNHIDTSDYYGPYTVNELVRSALHPYPGDLVIVTKVGARRGDDKSWPAALSAEELTAAGARQHRPPGRRSHGRRQPEGRWDGRAGGGLAGGALLGPRRVAGAGA